MPTADATLLPPVYASSSPSSSLHDSDDRGSARRLDEIGVEAVLGAMIEQKRRSSQPSFPAIELGADDLHDEDEGPPGGRSETTSEVFLKAR